MMNYYFPDIKKFKKDFGDEFEKKSKAVKQAYMEVIQAVP